MNIPLLQRLLPSTASWCALVILMFGFAAATGQLTHHVVPDSASYFDYPFGSLDAALRSIRTPGYPLLLRVATAGVGLDGIPVVHLLLHATAVWVLVRELRRWGTPAVPRWAAGLAVAFGSTSLDNLATISTDAPAASIGVLVAACLARWVRRNRSAWAAVAVVLLSVLAIAMRPAYLAIVVWIFVAGTLLLWRWPRGNMSVGSAARASLLLVLLVVAPLAGWMLLRRAVVDDFGLLPFGHQNLAGITVQLVSEHELLQMDGKPGQLAEEIVRTKDAWERGGRRLARGEAGATLTLESRWDDYVWRIIVPAAERLYPRDSVASHDAIADLNHAILARYPARYARWLALASRRAVWGTAANIAMHPLFLLCLVGTVMLELRRILRGAPMPYRVPDAGTEMLFVVAITYFAILTGFVILSSPPLGRFVDAAAIFLPAWLAARLSEYYLASTAPPSDPACPEPSP